MSWSHRLLISSKLNCSHKQVSGNCHVFMTLREYLVLSAQINKNIGLSETLYKGPWHAARSIYTKYGIINGLYKGCYTMLWRYYNINCFYNIRFLNKKPNRDVWTFGLYMVAYEHVLCMFKSSTDRSPDTSIVSQIVAGGIAGNFSNLHNFH